MLLPLGHLKTGKAGEVEVLLNFSRFFFADFQIIRIFAPTKPTLIGQGGSGHQWNPEATKPFVGQAEGERRLRTLHSVSSNFANLKPYTEVMQR